MVSQRVRKHLRPRISDHDIELIRILHEDHGMGYGVLARKFDVPKSTVQKWCKYRRR